jgi:hypothetical protein
MICSCDLLPVKAPELATKIDDALTPAGDHAHRLWAKYRRFSFSRRPAILITSSIPEIILDMTWPRRRSGQMDHDPLDRLECTHHTIEELTCLVQYCFVPGMGSVIHCVHMCGLLACVPQTRVRPSARDRNAVGSRNETKINGETNNGGGNTVSPKDLRGAGRRLTQNSVSTKPSLLTTDLSSRWFPFPEQIGHGRDSCMILRKRQFISSSSQSLQ